MELSENLFRHEAERMVATLTRIFGTQNLALAEDVVQDAFCRAFEVWKLRGVMLPFAFKQSTRQKQCFKQCFSDIAFECVIVQELLIFLFSPFETAIGINHFRSKGPSTSRHAGSARLLRQLSRGQSKL